MSKETQPLMNLKERCRICLGASNCMKDLFNETLLHARIKDLSVCTSIEIKSNENLPRSICYICLYKVDLWHDFKEQFIESNARLLSHLNVADFCETTSKRKSINEEEGEKESSSALTDKKKLKTDINSSIELQAANLTTDDEGTPVKTGYLSEPELPTAAHLNSEMVDLKSNDDAVKSKEKNEAEMNSSLDLKPESSIKAIPLRRGRTIERREASTKRWVARKRALIAATGEPLSDTDSMVSDDIQLSPLQKARAKTNIDKETQRQKRVANELRKLRTDMAGSFGSRPDSDQYFLQDSESDTGITTRSQSHLSVMENTKNARHSQSNNKSRKEANEEIDKAHFEPQSVRSELTMGDTTYIVTSTLVVSDPHYLKKTCLNKTNELNTDESSREKNTDIIDAVQLRRIKPQEKSGNGKYLEKCLNIEVEGTELGALLRVQNELATFIEKDIKDKIMNKTEDNDKDKPKDAAQTLDEKVKAIVEKAITKNFHTSQQKNKFDYQEVTPEFVKIAEKSKKYQPVVLLVRLDLETVGKKYHINNLDVVSAQRGVRTRPIVRPRKYLDYTDIDFLPNVAEGTPVKAKQILKTYGPASKQQQQLSQQLQAQQLNSPQQQQLQQQQQQQIIITNQSQQSQQATITPSKGITTPKGQDAIEMQPKNRTCGICKISFQTLEEIQNHMKSVHKSTRVTATGVKPVKPRMMRCKRCQAIVQAEFVKLHVCNNGPSIHKCYVCNENFTTDKALIRHLSSHDPSEFTIERVKKIQQERENHVTIEKIRTTPQNKNTPNQAEIRRVSTPNTTIQRTITQRTSTPRVESQHVVTQNMEIQRVGTPNIIQRVSNPIPAINRIDKVYPPPQRKITKVANIEKENIESLNIENSANGGNVAQVLFTCYVCDKTFADREVMRSHFQMHEDHSRDSDQHQCAICAETFENATVLEEHVAKHLYEDDSTNDNDNNINSQNFKPIEVHKCNQCNQVFPSQLLLYVHMPQHEEDAAIEEWAKQGKQQVIIEDEYICNICDETFDSEQTLSEHVESHSKDMEMCCLCEKPFRTLKDLQEHVDNQH